jgi:hypothetical protein
LDLLTFKTQSIYRNIADAYHKHNDVELNMQEVKYKAGLFNFLIVNEKRMKLLLLLPKLTVMAIIAMLCFLLDDIYRMAIRFIHAPVARFFQDLFRVQKKSENVPE